MHGLFLRLRLMSLGSFPLKIEKELRSSNELEERSSLRLKVTLMKTSPDHSNEIVLSSRI
jgi:hypothetical protein